MSMHMIASAALSIPELKLDDAEAKQLAECTTRVLRHFPNVQVAQKTMDITNLVTAATIVYGTRIGAYMKRRRGNVVEGNVVRPGAFKGAPVVPDGPG